MRYKITVYSRNIRVVDGRAQEVGRVLKNTLYAETLVQAKAMQGAIEMVENTEAEVLFGIRVHGQSIWLPPDMVEHAVSHLSDDVRDLVKEWDAYHTPKRPKAVAAE